MAGTFKAVLNKSGDSGHPCLVPDLRGNAFSFSLNENGFLSVGLLRMMRMLRMTFALCLSYLAYMMLRKFPSAHFLEFFLIINGC